MGKAKGRSGTRLKLTDERTQHSNLRTLSLFLGLHFHVQFRVNECHTKYLSPGNMLVEDSWSRRTKEHQIQSLNAVQLTRYPHLSVHKTTVLQGNDSHTSIQTDAIL